MAVEDVIIGYRGDITDISRKLKTIQTLNKRLAQSVGSDFTKGFTVVSRQLDRVRTVSKDIKLPKFGETTREVRDFSTTLKDANGNLFTVRESVATGEKSIKRLNSTVSAGGKATRTFGDNLKTLASRALLTIPVWFALRNSIFGVFRTIRDGLGDIATFDRALQKLRRNISATSDDVDADFSRVQKTIEEFSRRSGVAVQDVTSAIQRFATVGFDVETALEGGLRSTQLAITLFGDADETANAFARSLRVMTEGISDASEQQRLIAEALALTDQLWQTNAFEVNEFSGNLEKFAGTARIANLSIEDTLTLLATLSTGGLGNRAGRLLRSTLLRSLADIENITRQLDLDFDPNNQPTIVFIQELIDSLKELSVQGNVPAELTETIGELFTVRGAEVLSALTALEGTLKENLALTPDVNKFNKEFEDQLETVNRLVDRFKNLNKEIGRAFVTGLVGGNDFKESLKDIITLQEDILDNSRQFGNFIRDIGRLVGFISNIPTFGVFGEGFTTTTIPDVEKAFDNAFSKIEQRSDKFFKRILTGLNDELDQQGLERLVAEIDARINIDNDEFDITNDTLVRLRDVLRSQLEIQKEQTNETEKQNEELKNQEASARKTRQISELVLQAELDLLKARGASASQLLQAEIAYRKQLGIQKEVLDQVQDQINLEKEITKEQRLRSELGNESLKLFRIAQTEGVDVARQIGDVLAGNIDFSSFVRRGGQGLDIFKREFEDLFEQQQASAFFRGDRVPGLSDIRGGRSIAIEEQAIRGLTGLSTNALLSQQRAEARFQSLQTQRPQAQQTNNFNQTFNIQGENAEEIARKVSRDFQQALNNPQSPESKAIQGVVENF